MGSLGEDTADWDVVVVGGGFCGIWLLKHLREQGFKVHLFEHGSSLGGIWYWNNYPGSRVDTAAPTYQLWDKETFGNWDWKQLFPGRDELLEYFRHIERSWNLNKDISYNSKVTALHWDESANRWRYQINDGERPGTAWSVVMCTGFAAKKYIPAWKGIESFKGESLHTSNWPQNGFDLDNRRVAIIGTGATGVQAVQEISKTASHLTVFQRTPNTALPMHNADQTPSTNKTMRENYDAMLEQMKQTFAGFDYQFSTTNPADVPKEDRMKYYEELYLQPGGRLWLGSYLNLFFVEETNEEIYQFWRSKTLPRIKDKRNQELLAPEQKPHPFGTKRVSLEAGYFECFNRDNVELVSLKETDIAEFVPEGIKMSDGKVHEFDVIIFATGFDNHTGGMTSIDLRGASDTTIKEKWKDGVYTHLGIAAADFPNFFFLYGPQAPTAFATGPSHAQIQGEFVVEALKYMRDNQYRKWEPTEEAEKQYKEVINQIGYAGLFSQADSWYYAANIPGKKREPMNFMGGMPMYAQKLAEEKDKGYQGFVLTH